MEYANLSEVLKCKLEPALLVEIIGSSNLDLDGKNLCGGMLESPSR